jgi:transglutaminase-like putative cysteine protease
MKKAKALTALVIIVCILFTLPTTAIAQSAFRHEDEAWYLYRLGLYTGISTTQFVPDLGAKLDRQLGLALLLNFFGKKSEILAIPKAEVDAILAPYSDQTLIASWARPYFAYAIKKGIVKGTSPTTLGPLQSLDGNAFATMLLRQMGYTVEGQDYHKAVDTLCALAGLSEAQIRLFKKTQYLKDDAVGLVYAALFAPCRDGQMLLEKFIALGIVSAEAAYSQDLIRYNYPNDIEVVTPSSPKQPAEYEKAYDMILSTILQGLPSVKLELNQYTDTAKEVFELIDRIVREHPEILYYSGCTYSSTGLLTIHYSQDRNTILAHTEALMKKVDAIIKAIIKPGMTDFEKELAIHDYIIDNCRYDVSGYKTNDIPPESYSAYGALCLGVAVCEGYAEAAMLLLNRAGVECRIVTGISRGEGHAWNMVKIDGAYYHLDVTWDDPVGNSGSDNKVYHYFNLNDKEISVDHTWDKSAHPACTRTDYHYYTYYKLIAHSQEDFINQVLDRVKRGNSKITLKIANHKAIGFNIRAAVETLCNKLYRKCSYSFNDKLGIAELTFND